MEKLQNKDNLKEVSGGAQKITKRKYEFRCKRCGHKWIKATENPEGEHGCPSCRWWFMKRGGNRDANGNLIYDNECVVYDPKPKD